jgi:hypothetical protein
MNIPKIPKIYIAQYENYTHPEAFPLSIEHHVDGHYTYIQSAGSVRYDIEDVESFRQELLSTGWRFHSRKIFKK